MKSLFVAKGFSGKVRKIKSLKLDVTVMWIIKVIIFGNIRKDSKVVECIEPIISFIIQMVCDVVCCCKHFICVG